MQLKGSFVQITVQFLLAIAYVALMRQFLAWEVMLLGDDAHISGIGHILRVLQAVGVDVFVIYVLNRIFIGAFYTRLGLLIGVAIFGYYYVYNLIGHHPLFVYIGILQNPPYLFNMLLLVLAPTIIGKIVEKWSANNNASVVA